MGSNLTLEETDLPTENVNLTIELIKGAFTLAGTLTGGMLVWLGSWIADRRRNRAEQKKTHDQEQAVLTGSFAVTNFINARLNEWYEDGRHSRLLHLKTAQSYVKQLIDRSPADSERLMVTLIDVGLRLDALLAVAETSRHVAPLPEMAERAETIGRFVSELVASLDIIEVLVSGRLDLMTDEDLAKFPSFDDEDFKLEEPKP